MNQQTYPMASSPEHPVAATFRLVLAVIDEAIKDRGDRLGWLSDIPTRVLKADPALKALSDVRQEIVAAFSEAWSSQDAQVT